MERQQLFSQGLRPYGKQVPSLLKLEFNEIEKYLQSRKTRCLIWDEDKIAIPLRIKIQLPPLGNYNNIDIRFQEDILLVFDVNSYPDCAISVYSDRLDFPKEKLSHLYYASQDEPSNICLIRGNSINDWFAQKRIIDVIIRTQNWLQDAACGELNDNGDEFEPHRITDHSGIVIYQYEQLTKIVQNNSSLDNTLNVAALQFECIGTYSDVNCFVLDKVLSQSEYKSFVTNASAPPEKDSKINRLGFLLWSSESTTFNDYNTTQPHDWNSLEQFVLSYGISVNSLKNYITENSIQTFSELLCIISVRRPNNIIGCSSNIEFINIYLSSLSLGEDDTYKLQVRFQIHLEPLTTKKAREISQSEDINLSRSAIIGCGALGSKIIMHLARSGITNFVVFDHDSLMPHNLVRHALLSDYEGMNKAEAINQTLNRMYKYELNFHNQPTQYGIGGRGELLFKRGASNINLSYLFDFTASDAFFHTIIRTNALTNTKVLRSVICDLGRMGITYIEGHNRNPRIDDLQVVLFSKYQSELLIADWLKREFSQAEQSSIRTGLACNSETTIMPDDVVSLHAAFTSGVIKKYITTAEYRNQNNGFIHLSIIDNQENSFSIYSNHFEIEPLVVFTAINDQTWNVRIKHDVVDIVKRYMQDANPHETGGVLIGCANYKTRTIHIVDIIYAPEDSIGSSSLFIRGIKKLPESIKEINQKSGNQLGYIGEWHTHPNGPNTLSSTDLATVKKFKRQLESEGISIPVVLLIQTPNKLLVYVY